MKYNPLLHGTPKSWDDCRKRYKGGGSSKTTTTQEIPDELKPLATEYTNQAINLSRTPYKSYTGDRYADLTNPQLQGLSLTAQRALVGDALINAGYGNVMDTLNGKYMNSNPYLDQMFTGAADRITDAYRTGTAAQTDASFANSRNLGGSAYQQMVGQNQTNLADSVGNLAANICGKLPAGTCKSVASLERSSSVRPSSLRRRKPVVRGWSDSARPGTARQRLQLRTMA